MAKAIQLLSQKTFLKIILTQPAHPFSVISAVSAFCILLSNKGIKIWQRPISVSL